MENNQNFELGDLGEVSISYLYKRDLSKSIQINAPKDAFRIAYHLMDKNVIGIQEQFVVIYLNRENKVIGTKKHFLGTLSSVNVEPKLILATAINLMASSIIMAHNHPSGNLNPSRSDHNLTNRMIEVCKLLDIEVLDHLILSPFGSSFGMISNQNISM